MTRRRILLLFAQSEANATLAYQRGWVRAFLEHPRFECVPVNVRARTVSLALTLASRRRVDAIVLLHSVFSNELALRPPLGFAVARHRAPKALFLGNEYKLMPEKIAFCERLGVELLVSQLLAAEARALYEQRLGCHVFFSPSAGLDTELFAPRTPRARRPVDVGYRAYNAPWYLGNRERQLLALEAAPEFARRGFSVDVSLDPQERFAEPQWAAFLDRCRAQLGSEAGGDYFELTDATRMRVSAFVEEHPDAPFDEVFDRFFRNYERPVSGRALSGRIVEAAGTKTVQLLLDGEYGGYFRPDEHYIPFRRDLSDLDEAAARLRDDTACEAMADAAYEVAVTQLTYERLIDRFADALDSVLSSR